MTTDLLDSPAGLSLAVHEAPLDDVVLRDVGEAMQACFRDEDIEPDFIDRVHAKPSPLLITAADGDQIVGFKLGFERSAGVFTSWLGGTVPEYRRRGLARAMLRMQHAAVEQLGYHTLLTESANRFRGMIILNLQEGFEIVGTQWSVRRGSLGILFAKHFSDSGAGTPLP